ncbi:restriction endonuclease [Streptomyces sp. Inha503]|uniref:restriction endonuclease n=1 Tax=Streptomyces sp. Inha503 TaxID=3383314 RepID=UPI0039A3084C
MRAVDPAGRVWAIQCKHRRDGDRGSAVGVGVLQQVNGTARQIHGADIALVLTNGRFSSKAIPWRKEHRIHLVDRRKLGEWAASSRPLWELLDRIPPPHVIQPPCPESPSAALDAREVPAGQRNAAGAP